MPYTQILVPLDGTHRSEAILPQVEQLARQYNATLLLLEVLEPLPPHALAVAPALLEGVAAERTADIERYVDAVAGQLRERGCQAQAIVEAGSVVETILAVAARHNADLIALASHGYTGLARFLYGSIAADLLHRTRLPLLVLHAEDE